VTDIVAIQEKILDTSAMLTRLDAEAFKFPGDAAFTSNYRSIEKRLERLQLRLREAAAGIGLEVCSYRLASEGDNERIPIAGVAAALGDFQFLLGIINDALRAGPRNTLSVTKESARKAELDFSYAMAGSAVFVMTVPADKDLTDDSQIRNAVDTLFGATTAKQSDDVRAFSKRVGTAPVRALARWARHHIDYQLSAEVTWHPSDGSAENLRMVMSTRELTELTRVIEDTSDDTVEEETYHGTMIGANTDKQTFHFKPDGDRGEINGNAGDLISQQNTVELPRRYEIRVRKVTRIKYSTDQEQTKYHLLQMTPI
jgi:hypothetical protein